MSKDEGTALEVARHSLRQARQLHRQRDSDDAPTPMPDEYRSLTDAMNDHNRAATAAALVSIAESLAEIAPRIAALSKMRR